MERMGDGRLPQDFPAVGSTPGGECKVSTSQGLINAESTPNRWGMLLQALTGTFQPYYSCEKVERDGPLGNVSGLPSSREKFRALYGLKVGSTTHIPYDDGYHLPYHRPVAGSNESVSDGRCLAVPGKMPGSTTMGASKWGYMDPDPNSTEGIAFRNFNAVDNVVTTGHLSSPTSACSFDQANDGQLDVARDYLRFSLMTFDSDPDTDSLTVGHPICGLSSSASCTTAQTGAALYGSMAVATSTQWSPFLGQWSYTGHIAGPSGGNALTGKLLGCPEVNTEVGARAWFAPPWEGKHVRFPSWNGSVTDMQFVNDEIQRVLLATRPFGATPISGMLEDAGNYMLGASFGPNNATTDPLTAGGCREQYVVLLTDGAPNQDMRDACVGSGGGPEARGGATAHWCPTGTVANPTTGQNTNLVRALYLGGPNDYFTKPHIDRGNIDLSATTKPPKGIKTFVIGFSVNGSDPTKDGFPGPLTNRTCRGWLNDNFNNDTIAFSNYCATRQWGPSDKGSTAEACCTLNDMAVAGSGGFNGVNNPIGAFFAENQADLVEAFGQILATISKGVTSRTTPSFSPPTQGASSQTATFTASFIPQANRPWSGDIRRLRTTCQNGVRNPEQYDVSKGDSFHENMSSAQAVRNLISVNPQATGTANRFEGKATIRPYAAPSPIDGVASDLGVERAMSTIDTTAMVDAMAGLDPDVFDLGPSTCKKSKAADGTVIPTLGANECAKVAWGFATSNASPMNYSGAYNFNVRCRNPGAAGQCSGMGAIYHSTPTVVGAPSSFNRDDSYRVFAAQNISRKQVLYVATTDGLLHAFDTTAGTKANNELFAFVPPAVLGNLFSNYPGGQGILLDGTPVVKDAVFERTASLVTDAVEGPKKWHTTLVAGIGSQSGYYALEVTDPVLNGNYDAPSAGSAASNFEGATRKRGPHFLWQLTTIDGPGNGWGRVKRKHKGKNTDQYQLFGDVTGTPAIATVFLAVDKANPQGAKKEVGVAILPGGNEATGAAGGNCPRAMFGAGYNNALNYTDGIDSQVDEPIKLAPRQNVRKWGANCNASAVPSRTLTIVRLDSGEILRVFGRKNQDVPQVLQDRVSDTPLDSPMSGVPVVYPSDVGQVAQKIFIGDADGTIWRFDISDPVEENWKGGLFFDTQSMAGVNDGLGNSIANPAEREAKASSPITVPPVISLDEKGNLVLSVATGEQETLQDETVDGVFPRNYVYSLTEGNRYTAGKPSVRPFINWYAALERGERVTGPMSIFDKTHYFATFKPRSSSDAVCAIGKARVYGWHYTQPQNIAATGKQRLEGGGLYRYPATAPTRFEEPYLNAGVDNGEGQVIPGLSILAYQSCAALSQIDDDFFGGKVYTASFQQQTEFSLFGSVAKQAASGGTITFGGGSRMNPQTPKGLLPPSQMRTYVDSWVSVVQ
jgi:type IV pilus assembly protein PilY1